MGAYGLVAGFVSMPRPGWRVGLGEFGGLGCDDVLGHSLGGVSENEFYV